MEAYRFWKRFFDFQWIEITVEWRLTYTINHFLLVHHLSEIELLNAYPVLFVEYVDRYRNESGLSMDFITLER